MTDEHKKLINQAKKGISLIDEHKTALSKARENIIFSNTHKINMSIANGFQINVYSSDGITLIESFSSVRNATKHFDISKESILKYARNGKLFKNEWILSIQLKE